MGLVRYLLGFYRLTDAFFQNDQTTSEREIRDLFAAHGTVNNVEIIRDSISGRSKGFGFVEMSDEIDKHAVIDALDGQMVGGRPLKVNVANPRQDRNRESAEHARPGARRWD